MTTVFLDTVGLIALWDESDQWHDAAESAFQELAKRSNVLLTTSYILAECGNAAARRPYRLAVDRLREQLTLADLLVFPTESDWDEAWTGYRQTGAAGAGLVDHLSFAVMRRLQLSNAFTNDRHFVAAGFKVLF